MKINIGIMASSGSLLQARHEKVPMLFRYLGFLRDAEHVINQVGIYMKNQPA